MGFPVETAEGEIVIIEEKLPGGELVAADGSIYTGNAGFDALRVELTEAGNAIENVADEASEAIGEVVEAVKTAGDSIQEDVSDLVDAVETAAEELKDAVEAVGDAVSAAADDPVGTAKDVLDFLDGDDDAPADTPTDDEQPADGSAIDLPGAAPAAGVPATDGEAPADQEIWKSGDPGDEATARAEV